jgi:hypothetical protein
VQVVNYTFPPAPTGPGNLHTLPFTLA